MTLTFFKKRFKFHSKFFKNCYSFGFILRSFSASSYYVFQIHLKFFPSIHHRSVNELEAVEEKIFIKGEKITNPFLLSIAERLIKASCDYAAHQKGKQKIKKLKHKKCQKIIKI